MVAPKNLFPRILGLLAAAACALQGACHPAARESGDMLVPLVVRPTEAASFDRAPYRAPGTQNVVVLIEPVEDTRPDPAKIGENIEEPVVVPVHATAGAAGEFVGQVFEKQLRDAGLRVTTSKADATRTVHVRLDQFFTTEKNTYKAEVRAGIAVKDAAGKTLWEGPVEGRATRFGRSLKAENYQEVFSDATQRMVATFLNSPGARDALTK